MSYATTRRLVLAAGLGVLLLIAAVMYLRRVDTVEVVAVLLFIPIFLAFTFWHVIGGLASTLAASAAYAALRAPAVDAVGGGRYAGILAGRGLGYLAFGLLGGWASQQLERSLQKLDVYDQVDDDTGLFNARFLVQDIDLEKARASRYKTFFSVCMVEVPSGPLEAMGRRSRASLLKDLGYQMKDAVRTVDRPAYAKDGSVHRFAVICPETGEEGARVFSSRLGERIGEFVRGRGVAVGDGPLVSTFVTYPGDDSTIDALKAQFAAIDREQHPESPAVSSGS
ncbi:MAG TPA: GGDEF domain-containing protein [Acidimicrobiales bacterium]|nr:GGDEF domain-containing protein [Acidimicrobiales bacterium]